MKVLAGDVGGTHCRLAVCEVSREGVERLVEVREDSRAFETFGDVVRKFVVAHGMDVRAVCFGLPGPVRGRRAVLTNLPWVVDADQLERELGLPRVSLLNDLEATAHGLGTLTAEDMVVLRAGVPYPGGNFGLIAAGTGLGQAGLVRGPNKEPWPFPTEGGHTDFAPANDLEIELLRFLQARFGAHVSWERILSGPGLVNVYDFFAARDGGAAPKWLVEELASGDPAEVVARNALEGKSEVCRRALALFLELYGAEAGNLALKVLATGGMFIGGGIAPKLLPAFADSRFVERFDAKGRMRPVLEQMPIRLVTMTATPIHGAAHFAARHADPSRR